MPNGLEGRPKEVAEELAKLDRGTQLRVIEAVMGDHSVCRKMLDATGRGPGPDPDPSAAGVQRLSYTVGEPKGRPAMRKIAQPLIDTVVLHADRPLGNLTAFVDSKYFEDRTPKTERDTNMWQSGNLGHPLEYELRWIELHFEEYESPQAAKFVLSHMKTTFFFGCNTPHLRVAGAAWKPLVGCPRHPGGEKYTSPEEFARAVADEVGRRGGFWAHYWHPIGDPDGFRRIDSTESFRIEAAFPEGIRLSRPVRLKFAIQDTLHTFL